MINKSSKQICVVTLLFSIVVLTAGCSNSLSTGRYKINEYTRFQEFLDPLKDENSWYWVRSRSVLDLDRQGKRESVIIVSLHRGEKTESSPIEQVWLLVFENIDPAETESTNSLPPSTALPNERFLFRQQVYERGDWKKAGFPSSIPLEKPTEFNPQQIEVSAMKIGIAQPGLLSVLIAETAETTDTPRWVYAQVFLYDAAMQAFKRELKQKYLPKKAQDNIETDQATTSTDNEILTKPLGLTRTLSCMTRQTTLTISTHDFDHDLMNDIVIPYNFIDWPADWPENLRPQWVTTYHFDKKTNNYQYGRYPPERSRQLLNNCLESYAICMQQSKPDLQMQALLELIIGRLYLNTGDLQLSERYLQLALQRQPKLAKYLSDLKIKKYSTEE